MTLVTVYAEVKTPILRHFLSMSLYAARSNAERCYIGRKRLLEPAPFNAAVYGFKRSNPQLYPNSQTSYRDTACTPFKNSA